MGIPSSDHSGHDRGERSGGKERGIYRIYGGILEWSELRRCIRRVSDQLDELPVCSHDRWNHEHTVPFIQRTVYF